MNTLLRLTVLIGTVSVISACATQSNRVVSIQKVAAASKPYSGSQVPISIGSFENRSDFMRGVFSDGNDQLGRQARTSLVSHLQQSQRFSVLDRMNLAATQQEATIQKKKQNLKGANYVVAGSIAEFGRKQMGDKQLFGILGRGLRQIAYAKVTLNVINTITSEVVYSTSGAGEYALSNREVLGFGGTASYDSTLTGKVIDLAMREAIDGLASGVDAGNWGKASVAQ